jgi:hypothetical protein
MMACYLCSLNWLAMLLIFVPGSLWCSSWLALMDMLDGLLCWLATYAGGLVDYALPGHIVCLRKLACCLSWLPGYASWLAELDATIGSPVMLATMASWMAGFAVRLLASYSGCLCCSCWLAMLAI